MRYNWNAVIGAVSYLTEEPDANGPLTGKGYHVERNAMGGFTIELTETEQMDIPSAPEPDTPTPPTPEIVAPAPAPTAVVPPPVPAVASESASTDTATTTAATATDTGQTGDASNGVATGQ